jgi:hypothetical protein
VWASGEAGWGGFWREQGKVLSFGRDFLSLFEPGFAGPVAFDRLKIIAYSEAKI